MRKCYYITFKNCSPVVIHRAISRYNAITKAAMQTKGNLPYKVQKSNVVSCKIFKPNGFQCCY